MKSLGVVPIISTLIKENITLECLFPVMLNAEIFPNSGYIIPELHIFPSGGNSFICKDHFESRDCEVDKVSKVLRLP